MMAERELFTVALKGQADGQFPVMKFMSFWPETVQLWQQTYGLSEDLFADFGRLRQPAILILSLRL